MEKNKFTSMNKILFSLFFFTSNLFSFDLKLFNNTDNDAVVKVLSGSCCCPKTIKTFVSVERSTDFLYWHYGGNRKISIRVITPTYDIELFDIEKNKYYMLIICDIKPILRLVDQKDF